MSVSVKLNLRRLRRVIAGEKDAIDRGTHRGAEMIADLAQQLAPEDTGDLKASKQVTQVREGVYRVSFGAGLPDARAIYQEFGTRTMAAQPYLYPALRQINVRLEIERELRELIR